MATIEHGSRRGFLGQLLATAAGLLAGAAGLLLPGPVAAEPPVRPKYGVKHPPKKNPSQKERCKGKKDCKENAPPGPPMRPKYGIPTKRGS